MNLKVYERTRYQNIYRHKKNKNYLIMISKPVKSSISSINGEKIWKIDDALKIRDNPKISIQKKAEILYKDNFDELWLRYINWCKYTDKQSYNNIQKKEIIYNAYFKEKFTKQLNKITQDEYALFIDRLDTTDKQKNHILKILKAFLNWCVKEKILLYNPTSYIKNYKVEKVEMKFWETNEIQKFFNYINSINTKDAYMIKILVLIGITIGDRIGETRALTFGSIDKKRKIISIKHSINYDTKSNDFVSDTKTYSSQRDIDVSDYFIKSIEEYEKFLIDLGDAVNKDTLIFFNHKTKRPFSDTALRKKFYKFCDDANVSHIRMYDLRHTFTTAMMEEDVPLYIISKMLGHTSYRTTVDKYGHISDKKRKEITKITDNLTS